MRSRSGRTRRRCGAYIWRYAQRNRETTLQRYRGHAPPGSLLLTRCNCFHRLTTKPHGKLLILRPPRPLGTMPRGQNRLNVRTVERSHLTARAKPPSTPALSASHHHQLVRAPHPSHSQIAHDPLPETDSSLSHNSQHPLDDDRLDPISLNLQDGSAAPDDANEVNNDGSCPLCHHPKADKAHILWNCPATQVLRTKRNDELTKLMEGTHRNYLETHQIRQAPVTMLPCTLLYPFATQILETSRTLTLEGLPELVPPVERMG